MNGKVTVRTRRGNDVTAAVPELSPLPHRDLVLDGELVVGAGRLSDFYGLAGRLAGRPRHYAAARVTFAAFDVLRLDHEHSSTNPTKRVDRSWKRST